jgi:transglutaminase-like putative cysteine protease
MKLIFQSGSIGAYLAGDEIIDIENKRVKTAAQKLVKGSANYVDAARAIYAFVRDGISHSCDIGAKKVCYKASEVLKYGHGVCYAKSALLAALMRSADIPAGLCYQGIRSEQNGKNKIILHGFNAVYLRELKKWIRLDARGNKDGIAAEFSLHNEKLAYNIDRRKGEHDNFVVYAAMPSRVSGRLKKHASVRDLEQDWPE